MKVTILNDEAMYGMLEERYNPPSVQNQKEQNAFQAEIRTLYTHLLETLAPFGEEGDFYGISDFAVRPDLRQRATVIPPPAKHVRQFTITILTERFYRSEYLERAYGFLCADARNYRLWIDQDFDPNWSLAIIMTTDVAYVNCTSSEETSRLTGSLEQL